jgi:phosphoribosylformimino-5-aminoimidazole carboxamide ribotide isomerase
MEVIPVLDIMGGIAVSGKSGRRDEYTSLKTVFADSSIPLEIAENLPCKRLYVADLDGIMKGAPNIETLEELCKIKNIMVDAGIKNIDDYGRIAHINADIILGSETLRDLETLEAIKKEAEVIVSIDIKEGKLVSPFLPDDPFEAFNLLKNEVKKFIILNISRVGTLSSDFSFLEKFVVPDVEIYYGGGIKKEDIEKLKKMGVDGVLVGTALHKGFFKNP